MKNASRAEVLALRRFHRLQQSGRLRELREANGWTQSVIARAIGVSPSRVSRWESADGHARPEHAVALLELLDGDD